jgi:hypothetical protein
MPAPVAGLWVWGPSVAYGVKPPWWTALFLPKLVQQSVSALRPLLSVVVVLWAVQHEAPGRCWPSTGQHGLVDQILPSVFPYSIWHGWRVKLLVLKLTRMFGSFVFFSILILLLCFLSCFAVPVFFFPHISLYMSMFRFLWFVVFVLFHYLV